MLDDFPFEELAALQDGLRRDLGERLAQQDARILELVGHYARKSEEPRAKQTSSGLSYLRARADLEQDEQEEETRADTPTGSTDAWEWSDEEPSRGLSVQSTDASEQPDPDRCQQSWQHGSHAEQGVAKESSAAPVAGLEHRHSFLKSYSSLGHKYVAEEGDIKLKTSAFEKVWAAWTRPLDEPEHSGCLAKMVNSNAFGMLSSLLVLLTCVTSILVANYKMEHLEEEPPILQITGTVLTLLFITEIALKLVVHRAYFFMAEDRLWSIFDFSLACSEVWGIIQMMLDSGKPMGLSFLRSLRILKITRVLRMVRVISAFKELRLFLNALTSTITTVMWCGVVIVFSLVMWSMVFVQMGTDYLMSQPDDACDMEGECLRDQLQKNFGSVQGAALSLFMATTGGNDWSFYYDIFEGVGWLPSTAFVVFTFCFQFGMFNLLTSMFVDKAMAAAKPDLDMLIVQQRTNEHEQCRELREQLVRFDRDGGGTISLDEFEEMIKDEAMSSFLASFGLDISDAAMFFQMMTDISGEESVSTNQFVQGCMRMKGLATSIDMQAMRFELKLMSEKLGLLEGP